MDLFLKRPDAEEIKVNWLQDIGPIYPFDAYVPHVLLHNPVTENDCEYICLFCNNKTEAIAIIDHIISLNGGIDKFLKHEQEKDMSHRFSGHLFNIGYRNKLSQQNHVIVELNRREERKVVSFNDNSEILYGIHKDSKKINSIIKGLNSIVYNSGEMTSGGGHLYFDSSGSHIVSYWDDIENAIEQFKSIVDSYPENAVSKDLFIETEIKDFSYKNLLEIINNEGFLIEFKTDDFKINLSQGNSSFQMNIYIDEDELIINETERLEKERASLMSNEEIIEEVAENEIEIQEKERLKKIAEIKKQYDKLTYYVEGRKYSLKEVEKSNALKKQRVSLLTDKEIIEEIIAYKRRVASSRRRSARRVDWAGEPILTFLEIEFINRGLIRDLTPVEAELVSEFISKIEEIQLKFEEKERERQDELVHRENIKFKQAARAQAALQIKLNKKWWEFWK